MSQKLSLTWIPSNVQPISNEFLASQINKIEDPYEWALVIFACTTGLPIDNITTLKWQDLLSDGRVRIAHNRRIQKLKRLQLAPQNVALLKSVPVFDNRFFYGVQWPRILWNEGFTAHHAPYAHAATVAEKGSCTHNQFAALRVDADGCGAARSELARRKQLPQCAERIWNDFISYGIDLRVGFNNAVNSASETNRKREWARYAINFRQIDSGAVP